MHNNAQQESRSALFICTQHWESCFQVGMHHIARSFAQKGWRVGFLSAPVGLPHLLGFGHDARERTASWRRKGTWDSTASVWHHVPLAALPWGVSPIFAHRRYVPLAWAVARPGIRRTLRHAGFFQPDFACADHFLHEGLLRAAEPAISAFRRADSASGFPGALKDFAQREAQFARSVHLTIVTNRESAKELSLQGTQQTLLIENGLSLERFCHPCERPSAYRADSRPAVVFVGSPDSRLDTELLLHAVRARPAYLWTFIGPFHGPLAEALQAAGALLPGSIPHQHLAAWLQHARVGIVPFSRHNAAELVRQTSSLKIFEYAACGLPVVTMRGPVLPKDLPTPLAVCDHEDEFLEAIDRFIAQAAPPLPDFTAFKPYDWPQRLSPLFDWLDQPVAS